jgi:hypothetical protein
MDTTDTPSVSEGFQSDNTANVQTLQSAFGDEAGGDILESISQQINGTANEEKASEEEETEEVEESEDESGDIEEGSEDEEVEEVEEEEADVEDNRVKYKAKVDGEDQDLPDDAIIKIKVDGKETDVELAELIKNYNGAVVWEKRFEEVAKEKKALVSDRLNLDNEKTQFQQKAKTVDTKLNEIFQLSQTNPIQCVMELCKMAGLNSKEAMANYIVQANKVISEWGEMDVGSRQALLDRIELEQRRAELSKVENERQEQANRQQFHSKLTNLLAQRGADVDEFRVASNYLLQNRPELFADLSSEDEIAERVLDTMSVLETYNDTESVVMKIAPQRYGKLSQEDKRDFINELVSLKISGASEKDIARTVREVFGVKAKTSNTNSESPKPVATKQAATVRQAPKKSGNKNVQGSTDVDQILKNVLSSGF